MTAAPRSLLWTAAICSILGGITTLLLVFTPDVPAQGFEARAALHNNTQYLFKLWVLFVHPQLNLIASLGIAAVLFQKKPTLALIGGVFLLLWAFTEITQQALLIDALNQFWRPGFLAAEGDLKESYRTLIIGTSALSDSQYFVVIYSFGMGSLLFGLAFLTLQERSWETLVLGFGLASIGLFSLLAFLSYYLGFSSLGQLVGGWYQWIYPYLQPLLRFFIGVWLIRLARA